MPRAILITAAGHSSLERYDDFSLMRAAVGGYVQSVPFNNDACALCNEDGIALQLPRNEVATNLAFRRQIGLHPNDYFKGNVILVGAPDDDGEWTDVPEHLVADLIG